jgi:alpha-glucosidase
MIWIDSAPGVLAFSRGMGFAHVTNLSDAPVELPSHTRLLLTSEPLENGLLPTDSSAWLRTQH